MTGRGAAGLDLTQDPVALTAALVDVASVSGTEAPLADLVEQALRGVAGGEEIREFARAHGVISASSSSSPGSSS